MRLDKKSPTAIKGKFDHSKISTADSHFLVSEISQRGIEKLKNADKIYIEVIGMASRVIFITKILNIDTDVQELQLLLPKALLTIERRANHRAQTKPDYRAFINLKDWQAETNDLAAPPAFSLYQNVNSWNSLHDISIGGVCITSLFPSVYGYARPGKTDVEAEILIPRREPIPIKMKFCWKRTIPLTGIEKAKEYRIGAEFTSIEPEAKLVIENFVNQGDLVEAI